MLLNPAYVRRPDSRPLQCQRLIAVECLGAGLGCALLQEPLNFTHAELSFTKAFSCTESEIVMVFNPLFMQTCRVDAIVPMCATFKLLQATSMALEGNLNEIDALLSCALWMFDLQSYDSLSDLCAESRDAVCHTLFFAVNWFREVGLSIP
jgi:hypothetical protein